MPSEVVIDNKEYVILSKEKYESLTKKQIYEKYKGELLTLEEAKARTLARMEKWDKLKIIYSAHFADDVADLIFFIERKGMLSTSKNNAEKVFTYIESLDFKKVN